MANKTVRITHIPSGTKLAARTPVGIAMVLSAVLAACAPAAASRSREPAVDPVQNPPSAPDEAPVDRISSADQFFETGGVRHSVPLEAIIFDTFQPVNRAVPYPEMTPERIEQLRDAIPPIYQPKYVDPAEGDWLLDSDLVIGYVSADGTPYAYPTKILNYHEIVNDVLAGQPVAVTYCPLCSSALVYDRRVGDRTLTFGNTSALYESDMVMVDNETDSYWNQVGGEAIVGQLTGSQLTLLPATTTTWLAWREAHPDSQLLSRDTGYPVNYERDAFAAYPDYLAQGNFAFPVSSAALDDRLSPATIVLTVEIANEAVAFPLADLGQTAIHTSVGGQPLVIFATPVGPSGAAFIPEARNQTLSFAHEGDAWRDRETGSTWSVDGLAVDGTLAGAQLPRVPARYLFWFSAVANAPDIRVYSPD